MKIVSVFEQTPFVSPMETINLNHGVLRRRTSAAASKAPQAAAVCSEDTQRVSASAPARRHGRGRADVPHYQHSSSILLYYSGVTLREQAGGQRLESSA